MLEMHKLTEAGVLRRVRPDPPTVENTGSRRRLRAAQSGRVMAASRVDVAGEIHNDDRCSSARLLDELAPGQNERTALQNANDRRGDNASCNSNQTAGFPGRNRQRQAGEAGACSGLKVVKTQRE